MANDLTIVSYEVPLSGLRCDVCWLESVAVVIYQKVPVTQGSYQQSAA